MINHFRSGRVHRPGACIIYATLLITLQFFATGESAAAVTCTSIFEGSSSRTTAGLAFSEVGPRLLRTTATAKSSRIEFEVYVATYIDYPDVAEYITWMINEIDSFFELRDPARSNSVPSKMYIVIGREASLYTGTDTYLSMPFPPTANDSTKTGGLLSQGLVEIRSKLFHELAHLLSFNLIKDAFQNSPVQSLFLGLGKAIMELTFWNELYETASFPVRYVHLKDPSNYTDEEKTILAQIESIRLLKQAARQRLTDLEAQARQMFKDPTLPWVEYGANPSNDLRLQGSTFIERRLAPYTEVYSDLISYLMMGNHDDYFAAFESIAQYLVGQNPGSWTVDALTRYYLLGRGFVADVSPQNWTYKEPHTYFAPVRSYIGTLLNPDLSNGPQVLDAVARSLVAIMSSGLRVKSIGHENQQQLNEDWIRRISLEFARVEAD